MPFMRKPAVFTVLLTYVKGAGKYTTGTTT